MKPLHRVLLAFLLLSSAAAVASTKSLRLDPSKAMSQYVIASWRDTSGLPVDSVGAIAQTQDGYLWLATEHGLVRFDGVNFTVFSMDNTPALRSNEIYTLFVASDGILWIGTRGGGAVRYDGRQFTRVPVRLRYIIAFAESGDRAIWIGAPGGVARYRDGKYTLFDKEKGYPGGRLAAMAGDGEGVYLALGSAIIRLSDRGARTWTETDGLSAGPVTSLLFTSSGLLAGTESGALYRLTGDRFQKVFSSTAGHAISSILEGANNSLWMSTIGGGIVRYAGGQEAQLTERDGLSSDSVNQLFEDDEGNVWAATIGGGVVRLKEGTATTVVTPTPLSGEWILPLLQARDGSIWFNTNGGGLNRLHENSLIRLTTADGLHSNMIAALAEDRQGSIWTGSEGAVQRIAGGRVVQTITRSQGLEGTRVYAISAARDGGIWVSTNAGLHHVKNGIARKLTEKDGIVAGPILAIREAGDGSLWLAKPNAIEHLVDGKLVSFSRPDGLVSQRITSLTIDEKDGAVWVTTAGDGLARIRDGRVRMYRAADGLLSDSAYSVVQDRNGNLWIPTSRGLFNVKRAAIQRFDARHSRRIPITVFRKADGLKSSDFSGGFDRAGFRAFDGRLWFPTTRGLVVVDADHVRVNHSRPRAVIERIVSNGVTYASPLARIDVKRGKRQVEIGYTSPSYYSPETTTFRYKLEGFDEQWQEAGSRRTAYYTNIPPGTYRFVVEASTATGMVNSTASTIEIKPQFYETWPFKIAGALFVLLLAVIFHRKRLEAIEQHQDELRRSEEHFRSLIENASDMILVVERDGTVAYASPSVSRALGLDVDDMTRRNIADYLEEADGGAAFLSAVRRSRAYHTAELFFRHGSGSRRQVEVIGASLRNGWRVVLNCRDITDRRRLEGQLEQANRLASLGRLAATVSHEFNNVLMGIQPFVDVIRRRSDDRAVQDATTHMSRSVNRGKRISEQILRYTRPVDPTLRPVAVRSWLTDLDTEIRALVGPNVRMAIVAPSGLAVNGDLGQLNQVLTNLAINARDAGATAVRLEAHTVEGDGVFPFGIVREPERFAHIRFSDNGSGIPPSILARIFEPLFTTKSTKGTGLGLAVAQQVVARHGGELFVESRVGSGTTFHLFIPLTDAVVDDMTPDQDDDRAALTPPGCRVLLVEDDSSVSAGILTLLEGEGFTVDLAVNGGDALDLIPRFVPDIVVLDIGLPDMDGIEVYRRIAKRWPNLRVIFSTGHGDLAALQESMSSPQPLYLLKPYTVDMLLATIAEALDREQLSVA